MTDERISKMADNVVAEIMEEEFSPTIPQVRTAATPDEDVALANVDQAFDAMLAAISVIDDNLQSIKVESVPEQAAVDAIKDLMATALKPYLADALKAMQVFGK
jgi:hypothetical protein